MAGHKQIYDFLNAHQGKMVALLEKLVCIQSGTHNKPGVDRVGEVILTEMQAMGFACERKKNREYGDHIIARIPGHHPEKKRILMTGHMDTVFPEDTRFNYFKTDDQYCYGPGVADMKGGLVVGIFALKSLAHARILTGLPVTFIFNSEEEIGSPASRALIRKEALNSRLGFVLEAGGIHNAVVTGRKGNISARLDVTGKAGHAAFAGKDKASAILALAYHIIAVEGLNDPESGISVNVGRIAGGIGPNTVPDHATARIDCRFPDSGGLDMMRARLKAVIGRHASGPGTHSTLEVLSTRPAMPETKGNLELFRQLAVQAGRLGFSLSSEVRQGVSDANIIAEQGIPVIDGLGPVGAKDHSEDEYIHTRSLVERSLLLASTLACMDAG